MHRPWGAILFERGSCSTEPRSAPKRAGMFGRQNGSRGASFVAMVQTAHLWEGDNGACRRWLYGARLRTILAEREMRFALVMILTITR